MTEYLKGNYKIDQEIVEIVREELGDARTSEFERRCDEIQRSMHGLAGSVPYVKLTRKGQHFIWNGEEQMTEEERAKRVVEGVQAEFVEPVLEEPRPGDPEHGVPGQPDRV